MIIRRTFGFPNQGWQSAFQELDLMRRQMNSLFGESSREGATLYGSGVFPAINLTENKDSFYLRAELPGVTTGDLNIEVVGNNITVSGARKQEEVEGARYHRRERDAGRFSRVISLPRDVNAENISAELKNGILTVTMQKAEKAKPRQITIN